MLGICKRKMNTITLKGIIKNIQYSHTVKDIEYNKATLIVPRNNGKEDVISLKFKKFSNRYKENDEIELTGNIRSYSSKSDSNKNKVDIHVFTYFDLPDGNEEIINQFELDGRICKKDILRKTSSGKEHCQFILANNIITSNTKLNCYLPCVIWGKNAVKFDEEFKVGDEIKIKGQLHSREYTKYFEDGSCEFRIAYELLVQEYEK